MHLGLNQRLGLSRNKVAVPEGVAGTPPFWSPCAPGTWQHVPGRNYDWCWSAVVLLIQLVGLEETGRTFFGEDGAKKVTDQG